MDSKNLLVGVHEHRRRTRLLIKYHFRSGAAALPAELSQFHQGRGWLDPGFAEREKVALLGIPHRPAVCGLIISIDPGDLPMTQVEEEPDGSIGRGEVAGADWGKLASFRVDRDNWQILLCKAVLFICLGELRRPDHPVQGSF